MIPVTANPLNPHYVKGEIDMIPVTANPLNPPYVKGEIDMIPVTANPPYVKREIDLSHSTYFPWHFLYFFPLPHGQGSFRPIFSEEVS